MKLKDLKPGMKVRRKGWTGDYLVLSTEPLVADHGTMWNRTRPSTVVRLDGKAYDMWGYRKPWPGERGQYIPVQTSWGSVQALTPAQIECEVTSELLAAEEEDKGERLAARARADASYRDAVASLTRLLGDQTPTFLHSWDTHSVTAVELLSLIQTAVARVGQASDRLSVSRELPE